MEGDFGKEGTTTFRLIFQKVDHTIAHVLGRMKALVEEGKSLAAPTVHV